MTTKKIDSSGNYLPFVGFTVVADVYKRNVELFQRLHDQLSNSIVAEYNSLLPPESYHITTFAIIARKNLADKQWSSWMNKNLKPLRAVHAGLESDTEPFLFRFAGAHHKLLSIIVDIDPVAATQQRSVAKNNGYEKEIPRKMHISLGYQFKDFPDEETRDRVGDEFHRILADVAPDFETFSTMADQPKLCYYHSMLEFVPWDASALPPEPALQPATPATVAAAEQL